MTVKSNQLRRYGYTIHTLWSERHCDSTFFRKYGDVSIARGLGVITTLPATEVELQLDLYECGYTTPLLLDCQEQDQGRRPNYEFNLYYVASILEHISPYYVVCT